MKNISKRTLFHRLLFGCIPLLFLLMGSACEKDAEVDDVVTKLIGTWHQTSLTKDNISAPKDSSRLLLQINADRICILCDSSKVAVKARTIIKRSGWSYTNGLFNIATDLPISWKPVAEPNTLTLERLDFNQAGTISKTTLTFERVVHLEIN